MGTLNRHDFPLENVPEGLPIDGWGWRTPRRAMAGVRSWTIWRGQVWIDEGVTMIRKMCLRRRLVIWTVGLLMIGAGPSLWAQETNQEKKAEPVEQAKPVEPVAAAAAANSSPEALNTYTDAANFQNNSAFDLAAEEWARFLERFADDPLASKAQHYLGVCQLQLKYYA
jgi:hypothetical protein